MFEIGIFFVIVLAVSYWAVLWTMGRREDVLHGEFVEHDHAVRRAGAIDDPRRDPQAARSTHFPCDRPVFPTRPVFPKRPCRLSDLSGPPFRINRRFDRNGWSRC